MSWSITSIGKAADVAAEITANKDVPQPLKDLIAAKAKGVTDERNGLSVVTHGHHHGDTISTLHVEIKEIWLAPPAPFKAPDNEILHGEDISRT